MLDCPYGTARYLYKEIIIASQSTALILLPAKADANLKMGGSRLRNETFDMKTTPPFFKRGLGGVHSN